MALAPVASPRPASGRDRWLYGALVAAAVIRLLGLDAAPLWLDEVVTARWIVLPWGEMVRTVLADNHPPLYFLVLKGWARLAGSTPWALRFPSALASWATVPLVAALASILATRNAARWAAWFAALSPFLLHHGQEARMYAFVGALAAAQLVLLARFVTGRSRALGVAFVVTGGALVATHYYGAFLIAAETAILLVVRRRPWASWLPAALVTGLLVVGAFLTALLLATHHTGGTYQPGLSALPGVVWAMLAGYGLLPGAVALHRDGGWAMLPYLPAAAAALAALAIGAAGTLRASSRPARLVLGIVLGTTLLGPFAIGTLFPGIGTNPRYAAAGAPALLALIGIGAPLRLGRNRATLTTSILGLAVLAGTALHVAKPLDGREDVRAAGQWLDAHVPTDEPILITSRDMATVASYHWPERRFVVYPEPHLVVRPENVASVAEALPFPAGERAIYLLGRAWDIDPGDLLPRTLTERYRACPGTEVEGIRILCLGRAALD